MKDKILIIEDEIKTAQSIQKGLEEYHYQVDCAFDGAQGLDLALSSNYNLIISDIIMPNLNGIDLCNQLRQKDIQIPVLMLTALGTIDDKVIGFEAGADDYLVKPFEFKELLVRVRALLKRNVTLRGTENLLRFADMELDLDTKSVYRENESIQLTAREFALMEYFVKNPERIISKTEIAEKVWSINFDTGTNVIEVYVNYLRNKVDKKFTRKFIHTVHGLGYILKEK
jgi:two-component system, OmpR family, copper resistance phosphate regulon response regulator CusR